MDNPDRKLYISRYHLRCPQKNAIFFHGTGTLFPYSLGYLSYIMDNYDTSDVFFIGASGGALCACIGAMQISISNVLEHILTINAEYPPMRFTKGQEIFEKLYDKILPEKTTDVKNMGILVTCVAPYSEVGPHVFKYFPTKAHLKKCLLASKHIPFLTSRHTSQEINSAYYIDGVFTSLFDKIINILHVDVSGISSSPCYTTIRDICNGTTNRHILELYKQGYDAAFNNRNKIDMTFESKTL